MDATEARLLEEIRQRRADLVTRAESLRRSVVDTLDPCEQVRRHPVGSILASLGAGVLLGGAFPRRGRRGRGAAANGAAESAAPEAGIPGFASIAAGLLPSLLPMIVPLVGRLVSWFEPEEGRYRASERPRPEASPSDAEASNGPSVESGPS